MRFVIITGMSGSGKTIALKNLEDCGFYCVDNLPVPLISKFVELAAESMNTDVAIGVDIRSGMELDDIVPVLEYIDKMSIAYEILFLDSDDETLIKRYKETRRKHPLAKNGRLESGIEEERKRLECLRERADYILDTSKLLTKDLRAELIKIFLEGRSYRNLFINLLSFGFKYGIPSDADMIFDVRFLPNPFYDSGLKLKTGEDEGVRDYVFSDCAAEKFTGKLEDMINFLIPCYIKEGRSQLVIGIGCTGGQHRSVAIACELAKRLDKNTDIGLKLEHRDAMRNQKRLS